MDGGALLAKVHGVTKNQTRLSDFTFTFQFHALEKEMATHSSILAWRIPWTEEPGGRQSGVAKTQTRLSDFTFTAAFLLLLPRETAPHPPWPRPPSPEGGHSWAVTSQNPGCSPGSLSY